MNKLEPAGLDKDALEAAAQTVDPSGIFKLTWQECMERAEAAVLAYLNATRTDTVKALRDALNKAKYVPGDHPVVPVKIAAFMKEADRILSSLEVPAHPEGVKDDLREALVNLAHEMRFMLRQNPKMDGGLYRQRLDEADAAIESANRCPHNCDEGGICLAEHSGFPQSCPSKSRKS